VTDEYLNGFGYISFLTRNQEKYTLGVNIQIKYSAVYVAGLHAPMREFCFRTGPPDLIGEDHVFPMVDAAMNFIHVSTSSEKTGRNE